MVKLVDAKNIGEILIAKGAIDPEELKCALELQQKYGGRIGEILTHNGSLANLEFYQSLAQQLNLPIVDLTKITPSELRLELKYIDLYLANQFIVYEQANNQLIIATTNPQNITSELLSNIKITNYKLAITSPYDLHYAISNYFKLPFKQKATHHLSKYLPNFAIIPDKKILPLYFWLVIPLILGLSYYDFNGVISILFNLLIYCFAAMLIFKMILFSVGLIKRKSVYQIERAVPIMPDEDLPIYSILIPLFKEAEAASDIIKAIVSLDYPAHKIDAKLIVEEGDVATLEVIKQVKPDARFHIVIVPKGSPQTKPRACNYALNFVRGEYLVIYDAEDLPETLQLKQAANVFAHHPQIACLQARLNYYNAHENILTGLFALEYAILFDWLLPALYCLKIPIPLGGTSNHLRVAILREIGGWDAFNVTEDADLGLRLHTYGYRTLPIRSYTLEEAPISVEAWIKQRTRWIKGYMQSWYVFCKSNKTSKTLTPNSSLKVRCRKILSRIGAHLFIGLASVNYVVAIIAWGLVIYVFYASHIFNYDNFNHNGFEYVLIASLLLHWLMAFIAYQKLDERIKIGKINIILYPFYFFLHCVAGIRAAWQLCKNPYYWEKTTHSLSRFKRFNQN
jgi:cellulose synthase/poly-beta-1,6-N-acetylglucosamine synthase-like glycosyltransferase